jgi:hypothetical protein
MSCLLTSEARRLMRLCSRRDVRIDRRSHAQIGGIVANEFAKLAPEMVQIGKNTVKQAISAMLGGCRVPPLCTTLFGLARKQGFDKDSIIPGRTVLSALCVYQKPYPS